MTPTRAGCLRALACAGLSTTLAVVPVALANRKVVHDRRGDVAPRLRHYLDIRSASAGHQGRKLRHDIRVWHVDTDNTARALQLVIRTPSGGRYIVYGSGAGSPAPILNRRTFKQTGNARVRRRGKRVTFVFPRRAIGNPHSYRWAATANPNPGIYRGRSDRAPNHGFRRHRL